MGVLIKAVRRVPVNRALTGDPGVTRPVQVGMIATTIVTVG
jgi:hypothetical protein